jgi:hypothetical protein
MVLGRSRKLLRRPNYPLRTVYLDPAVVNRAIGEEVYATGLSAQLRRVLSLDFTLPDLAAYRESHDELFRKAGAGSPFVIVPTDLDSDTVIHGRIAPLWEAPLALVDRWLATYTVTEDPFPRETS